ncbi:hypothetical protein [Fibrobacter sp.]|uniref:hypothetical protein n=1 Tax=Fibrobacter sp. TaxID=35828 RepID=UPI00388F8F79
MHDDYLQAVAHNNRIRRMNLFSRQMAGLVGGQILGGAGDIATGLGYNNLGRFMSSAGEGVQAGAGFGLTLSMAGAGAKVAGPAGVIAGFTAAIFSATQSLARLETELAKTSEAFAENYKTLAIKTTQLESNINLETNSYRAEQLLESGNIAEARKMSKYWSERYSSARNLYLGMNPEELQRQILEDADRQKQEIDTTTAGNWTNKKIGKWAVNAVGAMSQDQINLQAKNMIDQDAQRRITDMQAKVAEAQQAMNAAKAIADSYASTVKQLEDAEQKRIDANEAEIEKLTKLSEANDVQIERFQTASRMT